MTTPSGTTSDVAAQRSAAGPAKPRRRRTVAKTLLALFALLLIAAALFLFWPLHQRCADLGGHLRTGLEDTFYLANGAKVTSNGQLIEEIAGCARRAGREIASPAEARQIFGTTH